MSEQILRFLGTGSSFNVNKSNNSAYLIDKNHLLLIDCGCTIFDEIVKSEILESITTVDILITYLHDDHVGSLSSLLHYIHFVKPLITKTKVYFMNNKLETLLSIMGTHEFEYEFVKIKPNVCFTIQGSTKEYKVLPVKVNHVDEISLRNNRKESFD